MTPMQFPSKTTIENDLDGLINIMLVTYSAVSLSISEEYVTDIRKKAQKNNSLSLIPSFLNKVANHAIIVKDNYNTIQNIKGPAVAARSTNITHQCTHTRHSSSRSARQLSCSVLCASILCGPVMGLTPTKALIFSCFYSAPD